MDRTMLIRSISRAAKKSCCSNCKSGKPCCGEPKTSQRFEKRGALWLPDNTVQRQRVQQSRLQRLELPAWPRDRDFILAVEKVMPIRRTLWRYGDPVRWRRTMQTIKALVTLPPDQWGGLVRWDLPTHMPVYDMSCTGCCDLLCCCENPPPTTLTLTLTGGGGSCTTCNGGTALATSVTLTATEICAEYPANAGFVYQAFGDFFCGCLSYDFTCGAGLGGHPVELIPFSDLDGPRIGGDVTSCDPFVAEGTEFVDGADLTDICGDDGTIGETFTFVITE
jgi:hypothetical protein